MEQAVRSILEEFYTILNVNIQSIEQASILC